MSALSQQVAETICDPGSATPPYEQLRRVHTEAAETAELANLPALACYAAALVSGATLLAILLARPELYHAVSFALLVSLGVAVLLWRSAQVRSHFLHPDLGAFAGDVGAIMLYFGFVWGAGAFLVLPLNCVAGSTVLYAASLPLLAAMTLRRRDATFLCTVPIAGLTTAAAYLRPLGLPSLTAIMALLVCGIVTGSLGINNWMKQSWPFRASGAHV